MSFSLYVIYHFLKNYFSCDFYICSGFLRIISVCLQRRTNVFFYFLFQKVYISGLLN